MDTTTKALAKHPAHTPSGRRRRRLRPLAEKRRIVEETLEPGASVSVVAQRHDVNANLVFAWRRLYRAGLLSVAETPAPLVPVRVKRVRVASASPVTLEVILPKGSIRVCGGIDARLLKDMIEALT
jgi:transposase